MRLHHQYIRTVRRPYPPLYASIIAAGSANPAYYRVVHRRQSSCRHIIVCDGYWYYVQHELDACGHASFAAWNSVKAVKNVERYFLKCERDVLKAACKDFVTYARASERYMPALQTIWTIDPFVAHAVRTALLQRLSETETNALMDALNIPLRDNYYKKEEHDLLRTHNLRVHVQKYAWIHSRYGEIHPYSVAEARAKRARLEKSVSVMTWRSEKHGTRTAIRRAKKLLGRSAYLIDLMQFIIYYRTQRTDVINRSYFIFAPTLASMARDRGLTYEHMLYCTKDEVLTHTPSARILNARMRAHATICDHGRSTVLVGKEYRALKALLEKDVEQVTTLKGPVACKGRAVGTARIITGLADFHKMRKGDILLASMTTPQMIPIMKKAAAFVTDEGGITCHAAIISRELKKPCVIGTKTATRVFKDGDRIEVDAVKGVVRKI